MRFILVLTVLFTYQFLIGQEGIMVNEVMVNNGNGSDWIELYNVSDQRVNLKGWYLSNNKKQFKKWRLPSAKLQPKSFLTIYANDVAVSNRKGGHTNFKLKSGGGLLLLSDKKGNLVDKVRVVPCSENISYGRSEDGGPYFERFYHATPGQSNSKAPGIVFSIESGIYDDFLELTMLSRQGDTIRYTRDGSIPNEKSKIYSRSVSLNSRVHLPDILTFLDWKNGSKPYEDNFKANVIRAATFKEGKRTSKIYTKTYFTYPYFLSKYKNFNIVSLVTDPDNLFQKDSGIYTGGGKDLYNANFNQRGKLWERDAHIICFNSKGKIEFDQEVGLRIHGQVTRKYPAKSFRICPSNQYDAGKIRTGIFKHTKTKLFDKLILRATTGDRQKTLFKDECTAYICRDLHVDVSDYAHSILFINGEYWGIYNLREYLGKGYVSQKYNHPKDSVNIVLHGADNYQGKDPKLRRNKSKHQRMNDCYQFMVTTDLSDSTNYEKVKKYLHIKSIIDFYCVQLFFGNIDYLNNNNKLWNAGTQGKWHQFLFDMDLGWMDAKLNTLKPLLNPESSVRHPSYATFLFRKLMTSPQFKTKFLNRLNYLMSHDLSQENLVKAVEQFKTIYGPVVEEHIHRWRRPGSVRQWKSKVSYMTGFAKTRHQYMREYVAEELNVQLK